MFCSTESASYCIKTMLYAINSHVLIGTNPCFNKAIHMRYKPFLRFSLLAFRAVTKSDVNFSNIKW